jgi:hypothetical protein
LLTPGIFSSLVHSSDVGILRAFSLSAGHAGGVPFAAVRPATLSDRELVSTV